MDLPKYSIAIRTLGTAGDKFVREIDSILSQTVLPDAIFAYIPNGYSIPEFSGSENITWIRSPKGMVSQRSLPFNEITTPYILFLDDDIEMSPDTVEKLFDPIIRANADVVVANVFPNHEGSLLWKFKSALDIPRLLGVGRFMFTTRYKGLFHGIKIRKSGIFDEIPAFNTHKR